ncbi:MAG: aspartyl protease family protein [Leptospiraceae bacterium]|nr:aspartyl protease family protein [Leptospiraceae bacterium]
MIQTLTKFFRSRDTRKQYSLFQTCLYFLLFLLFCKTTNASFTKDSNFNYHTLEIKLIEQPRIHLFVNHKNQKEEQKLSFVIDTGSNISIIRENIFTQKGIQKKFHLKSISGQVEKEFTELKLNLFDEKKNLISENSNFHSLTLDSKFSFDGIIGNDILGKFDLFLELPDTIFLIKPNQNQNYLANFKKIPFELLEGHIVLESKLADIPCKFILDTGAGLSYLNQKKAKELNLKIGGNASFIDLAGKLHETNYRIGENLCVDENICQKKIDLLSGNSIENFLSEEGNLDGILGLNWINKYSILIDYKNKSLYIKQR